MTTDSGSEALPPLYAKWAAALLGGPIPRETRATCGSCAMRAGHDGGGAQARATFFDPAVKCCTYLPTLYNFLVGRILSDQDPASRQGRETVAARIAQGIGVFPLGLMQTPTYALLYGKSTQSFGKSRSLKCPHYIEDGGLCGVWAHRESTCATWFCKHVKGAAGYGFWREGLHHLLQIVEIGLARWCLLELGAGVDMLKQAAGSKSWTAEAEGVTGAVLDNQLDQEAYARAWAEWRGREHAFFIRCAALVDPLSWAEVLEICGPDARTHAQLTGAAYRRMTTGEAPAAVKAGSFQVVRVGRETVRLNTYSEYDPIEVPSAVMELLGCFDGRPTADVLAEIARDRGVALAPDLVQKMIDFDLLVPVEAQP